MHEAHADSMNETIRSLGRLASALDHHALAIAHGRWPCGPASGTLGLRSGRTLTVVAIDDLSSQTRYHDRLDSSFRAVTLRADGAVRPLRVNVSDVETVTDTGFPFLADGETVKPQDARNLLVETIAALDQPLETHVRDDQPLVAIASIPRSHPFVLAAALEGGDLHGQDIGWLTDPSREARTVADLPDGTRLPLRRALARDELFQRTMESYRPYCLRAEWLVELESR